MGFRWGEDAERGKPGRPVISGSVFLSYIPDDLSSGTLPKIILLKYVIDDDIIFSNELYSYSWKRVGYSSQFQYILDYQLQPSKS